MVIVTAVRLFGQARGTISYLSRYWIVLAHVRAQQMSAMCGVTGCWNRLNTHYKSWPALSMQAGDGLWVDSAPADGFRGHLGHLVLAYLALDLAMANGRSDGPSGLWPCAGPVLLHH